MKKTYKIEVDCANCANLMEETAQDPKSVMKDVLTAVGFNSSLIALVCNVFYDAQLRRCELLRFV